MKKHYFKPDFEPIGFVNHSWDDALPIELLADETMLFSADWDFAKENGGPITQKVLKTFEDYVPIALRYKKPTESFGLQVQLVVDTRVHMLMKGMYPAIPGWHCDGVPRSQKYAQPNLELINPAVVYWSGTLSSNPQGCSQTEFVSEDVELKLDPKNVWASVDKAVKNKDPETWSAPDRLIVVFSQNQIHRATPCHTSGWRFFFRVGIVPTKPQNKIRKQVQVYTTEGLGW